MELDEKEICWIKEALAGVSHGKVELVINEKKIVKVRTETSCYVEPAKLNR